MMKWTEHYVYMREILNIYKILAGKLKKRENLLFVG